MLEALIGTVLGVLATLLVQWFNKRSKKRELVSSVIKFLEAYVAELEEVTSFIGHPRGDMLVFDPPTQYIDACVADLNLLGSLSPLVLQTHHNTKRYAEIISQINEKPLEERFQKDQVEELQSKLTKFANQIRQLVERLESIA